MAQFFPMDPTEDRHRGQSAAPRGPGPATDQGDRAEPGAHRSRPAPGRAPAAVCGDTHRDGHQQGLGCTEVSGGTERPDQPVAGGQTDRLPPRQLGHRPDAGQAAHRGRDTGDQPTVAVIVEGMASRPHAAAQQPREDSEVALRGAEPGQSRIESGNGRDPDPHQEDDPGDEGPAGESDVALGKGQGHAAQGHGHHRQPFGRTIR